MAIGRIPEPGTGIPESIIAAKGDLIVGTANDTPGILSVGTNGHTLVADSSVSPTGLKWAAPAGGGKVLQVVNATTSTQASNATDTFADSNLTASITPSATSSKVLVLVSMSSIAKSADANCVWQGRLVRGATTIIDFEKGSLFTNSAVINRAGASTNYLDSPSTTSSTTYKVQFRRGNSVGTVGVQEDNSVSTITLIEIGA